MIQPLLSWKTALALVAIAIVSGTVFYSRFLARKIGEEERLKVEQWVEAGKLLVQDTSGISVRLVSTILTRNTTIPIIVTDEKNQILDFVNLGGDASTYDSTYIHDRLNDFRSQNDPVEWINPSNPAERNLYYYGNTGLLQQVRYYPLVQLLIVGLFITVTLIALTTSFRSSQNQIWAGMAKETAHQLGTPLSSMQGWVEMLKDFAATDTIIGRAAEGVSGGQEKKDELHMIVQEMEKDLERLRLVSDRFGKIGSTPRLENKNLVQQVVDMMEYIRKRAPGKVSFDLKLQPPGEIRAQISPPLFDWVIENLLKNALDALEGKGSILITIRQNASIIHIDVSDSGKGISKQHVSKVFRPGFTTKKRGWGLGLSLSKRIIEQYHKGQLIVKHSEPGKGTTFRITLRT